MVSQLSGRVPSRIRCPGQSSWFAGGPWGRAVINTRAQAWNMVYFERHHWKGQHGGEAVPMPGGWREPQLGLVCQQSQHRVG